MKAIVKVVIVVMLLEPLLFGQKPAMAAQTKNGKAQPKSATSQSAAASDPNEGEALETPNHHRKRLAGETPGAPSPDEYPFKEAIDVLKPVPSTAQTKRLTYSAPGGTPNTKVGPPKDYQRKTTIPTSATANDAVELSRQWMERGEMPAEGKDGRVVFIYGAGLPTIICAPLRLCTIELQTGEKLTAEPQIGDSVRWKIEPASYGSGESTTPLIVLKPTAIALDTNLVITTDRRAYSLRLISTSENYVPITSFDYPDDDRAKWIKAVSNSPTEPPSLPAATSLEALNQNYIIKGDASIRPIMVLDDGAHTYIRMNSDVLHREAPILAVIGPDGKAELVNYRVQGSVYVVDRLFDRARLILGSGRKARKADIIRGSVKERRLFARDPFRSLPKAEQEGTVQ